MSAFDGETYDPALDFERLKGALHAVAVAMADGRWHGLDWLSDVTGHSEASVSARLRDLRKAKHGGWNVERMRHPDYRGVWLYRLSGKMPHLTVVAPADTAAPATPTRDELLARLGAVIALCEQADLAGVGHLRAAQVAAAAHGVEQ